MLTLEIAFASASFAADGARPLQASATMRADTGRDGPDRRPGSFALPLRQHDLPLLQEVLERHQRDPGALAPRLVPRYEGSWPDARATFRALGWLDPTNEQLLKLQLIRTIGQQLYAALFGHEEQRDLLGRFLRTQPAAEHRLVLAFNPPAQSLDAATLALMALPWETLWQPGAVQPLCHEHDQLLLIRTYQKRHPERPAAGPRHDDAGATLPELCKVVAPFPHFDSSDDLEQHRQDAARARPKESYGDGPIWCDQPLPADEPLTAPDVRAILAQHQPEIVHLFCHGTPVDRSFAFLFDDQQPGRPFRYSSAHLLGQMDRVRLLACFVCFSAKLEIPHDPGGTVEPDQSLVTALTEYVPATLAMQTRMPRDAAVRASEAFYQAISAGATLGVALRKMRKELYNYCTQEGQASVPHAWWVPVVYLPGSHFNPTFVDPRQRRAGHLEPAADPILASRQGVLDQLLEQIQPGRVIQLDGPFFSGKTTVIRHLARHLREQQQGYLALDTQGRGGAERGDREVRLTWLRREIASALAVYAGQPIHWGDAGSAEGYRRALHTFAPADRPFVVALDSCDEFILDELIPEPELRARVAFVLVTSSLEHHRREVDRYVLAPPLPDAERRQIPTKALRAELEALRQADRGSTHNELLIKVSDLLFALTIPLAEDDLLGVLGASNLSDNREYLRDVLKRLKQFLIQDEDRYYCLACPDLYQDYVKQEFRSDALKLITAWRDTRYAQGKPNYPEGLLAILTHRPELEPFPDGDRHKDDWLREQYIQWNELARRYYDELMALLLGPLVKYRRENVPSGQLDRAVMGYVQQRAESAQVLHRERYAFLWAAYSLRERTRLRRRMIAGQLDDWSAQLPALEPALTIDRLTTSVANLLRTVMPHLDAEALRIVRFLAIPLLRSRPDELHRLLVGLEPSLSMAQRATLGQAAALACRTSLLSRANPAGPLSTLLRGWIERGLELAPIETLPLLMTCLSDYDEVERERLLRRTLTKQPDLVSTLLAASVLPWIERLMIAGVLSRLDMDFLPHDEAFPRGAIEGRQFEFVNQALSRPSLRIDQAWQAWSKGEPTDRLAALVAYLWACAVLGTEPELSAALREEVRGYLKLQRVSMPLIVAFLAAYDALKVNEDRRLHDKSYVTFFKNGISAAKDASEVNDLFYAVSLLQAYIDGQQRAWDPVRQWYEVVYEVLYQQELRLLPLDEEHTSHEQSQIEYLETDHGDSELAQRQVHRAVSYIRQTLAG